MYMYVASNFGGGTKRSVPTTFSCRGRCKRSGSIPVDRKRFDKHSPLNIIVVSSINLNLFIC